MLNACGQKGPLYLPRNSPQNLPEKKAENQPQATSTSEKKELDSDKIK